MLALDACLNTLFGCYTPNSNAVITITYGTLAILAVVGFVVGFVVSIVTILWRRTYGIMVMVLQPIGLTYKRLYYKKLKATAKDFRFNNRTYSIDLTKTSWSDGDNRPVLVFLESEVMPLTVPATNKRLQEKLRKLSPMRLEMKRRGGNPSDAFDLLFSQKIFEAFAAAARRVQKTSRASLAFMVVITILVGIMSYMAGSAFPAFQVAHHVVTNSTTTSTSNFVPNVANGGG